MLFILSLAMYFLGDKYWSTVAETFGEIGFYDLLEIFFNSFFFRLHTFKQIPHFRKYSPLCQVCIKNFHSSTPENADSDKSYLKYGMYTVIGFLLSYETYRYAKSKFIKSIRQWLPTPIFVFIILLIFYRPQSKSCSKSNWSKIVYTPSFFE